MGKTKDLGHLASMALYDVSGNMTLPANLKINGSADVATQAYVGTQLGSYTPSTRSITINGTTYDLSADRSWTITSMIYPASGIALSTGSAWGTSITNNSTNWNTAYGWGNHASAGYATSSSLSSYLPLSGGTMSGSLIMGTSGTNYIRMGAFPNSTSNSGEAWIGRASDRNSGTMTVQLGGGSSSSRSFEVVDYAWTTVLFSVGSNGNVSASGSVNSSGTVTSGTGQGFLNAGYQAGYNRIWAFGNSPNYGMGYYQGGTDYIGFHFGATGSPKFTVDQGGNINSVGISYAAAYRGNANVAGTGEATYHPAGIYSTGTNWLYGTIIMNGNSITGANSITASSFSGAGTGLTGTASSLSIGGSAGSASSATYLNSSNYITRASTSSNLNTDFQNTPAGTYRYNGDDANVGNSPVGTWWFYENMRHSNAGNYWGTQIAWGWEDNGNKLAQRNISANSFSGWVYYLNSGNFTSYIDAPNKAGTSYYQANTWIQLNGVYGLYCPSINGAHFYPNDATYGTWRMAGSRGSYSGIHDSYSGVNGIMFDAGGNGGSYRADSGKWYYYFHLGNNCMGIADSTTSSSYRLYVSGSIYSTGDVVAYSDARLKTNINTIDNAIDKIANLRGVYYDKIGEEDKGRQTGVIAQETETIFPEVVTYAKDIDTYGVAYGNFAGLFIEGFKELKSKIKEQDKRIEELQNIINGFTE
jgi:hypothetical protein